MSPRCAFVFPGQGSQALNMGKDFFDNFDVAKEMFDAAEKRVGIDFKKLLFEENDMLAQTAYTQPAILLISMIAYKLFQSKCDIKPTVALGHSLGEFSALACVGALDAMDAVALVHIRGKLMAEACEGKDVGMLVSLGLEDDVVEDVCQKARGEGKQVWAVNYNTTGQIVIAGIKSDLEMLVDVLKDAGAKRAMLLNMSVASHCPLLQSAIMPLEAELKNALKDHFNAPVISNVTAKAYTSKEEALALLGKQLIMPVLYKQSIAAIDDEVDCYIEFGHGNILKGLHRNLTSKPHFNVSDMASLEATIDALKEL
ncbi:MAG: ACP S-malonyltransferase [Campylobacterales bacterium]|nr:ACP S-malonyltransferase [Campylobacterales bacterium]